jgi:hypothetical protein
MQNQTLHRLPISFQDALRQICIRLQGFPALWAITGSLGFWLHGMSVMPADIDLQTTAGGAYQMEKRLGGRELKKVSYSQSETIRSHYGALELEGVTVEIMGAVEKRRPDGTWKSPSDLNEVMEWVVWRGERLPTLSLQHELEAYRLLGRDDRAADIARFLRARPDQYLD